MTKPALVLLGAGGQLGQTLAELWPTANISDDFELFALNRKQLDISDNAAVNSHLSELDAKLIVNAAAYTAVDAAEENQTTAYRINADAVENLAQWSATNQARLIHVSTDFVFAGDKNRAYTEQDQPAPCSIYGASKLKGESAIAQLPFANTAIIRASWLYSVYKKNFLKTMLKLMHERDQLKIVSDQIGTPTSCRTLARLIFKLAGISQTTNFTKPSSSPAPTDPNVISGIYHCSDAGVASWYDFAVAIFEEAKALGLLPDSRLKSAEQILPITTSQYPTPASRPAFSVLDTSKSRRELNFAPIHWRQALRYELVQLKELEIL